MKSDGEKHKGRMSHVDDKGNARMVDVGGKKIQKRTARASGLIQMSAATVKAIREDQVKKGNVLAAARIAGIQAAKATPDLIPLCHTLSLDWVAIDFEILGNGVQVSCTVSCKARTGTEMEALTGTTVALLTIYDMCKAMDKGMSLEGISLHAKQKEDPDQ
jgi:cyclic pyranopterin phosphate synthase